MGNKKVNPDWPLPDDLSCPVCGEYGELSASIIEAEDGIILMAEVQCWDLECGNRWIWKRDE